MKLKKIASLALAGVMAVSMLAGCKYGEGSSSSSSSSEPVVVDSSLAGKVISELASTTTEKVSFTSAGSELTSAVSKMIEYKGTTEAVLETIDGGTLIAMDSTLGKVSVLPKIEDTDDHTTEIGTDSKVQKYVVAGYVNDGVNEQNVVKALAAKIDALQPMDVAKSATNLNWNELPDKSLFDDADDQKAEYCWSFEYTAEVAAVSVVDTDTGMTGYVWAMVLTRTPTKVEL